MKKLLLAILLLSGNYSFAQQSIGTYILEVKTAQPYTELTSGTNLTSSLVWNDENFKIPLGFSINIGGKTTSDFSFSAGEGFGPGTDTLGIVNTFSSFAAADLVDRGYLSATPKSPLRYVTTGVSPNRVFKFEVSNAGFLEESVFYSTLNDSLNFQIWIYETSGIVEFRYGTSQITHPSDYFFLGASPLVGYCIDFNLNDTTFTKAYTLTGSPNVPVVDSFYDFSFLPPVLSAFPSNGIVYRFVPKAYLATINTSKLATKFQVYPTHTTDNITVVAESNLAASGKIMDINGKVISQMAKISQGKNSFDVSSFAPGHYLFEITDAEGKAVYQFTKQ